MRTSFTGENDFIQESRVHFGDLSDHDIYSRTYVGNKLVSESFILSVTPDSLAIEAVSPYGGNREVFYYNPAGFLYKHKIQAPQINIENNSFYNDYGDIGLLKQSKITDRSSLSAEFEYVYLEFDKKKNWTKRICHNKSDSTYILETRIIEYK